MAKDKKKGGKLKKMSMLGGVSLLGILGVSFGSFYFISEGKLGATFEHEVGTIEIPFDDEDAIARGDYLVNSVMGCAHSECHKADLGGGAVMDAQPMGLIYAPNLTRGEGSVVNDYTPEDWLRILRHGVKKNGTRALIMPSEDYIAFSDADIASVIAYINSVDPVNRESKEHALGPVSRMLVATGKLPFAHDKIDHDFEQPRAEPGPTREWGGVLATTCTGCHGATLSGGLIPGGNPDWPEARNITPHETGIEGWTFEDFDKAMRTGERPDGTKLHEAMPYQLYKSMKKDDMRALWLHLETVDPKPAGGR